ncbi:hypothetical protein WEH80_04700 [Actinomycetes bacterium KLBMP 9759]
MSWLSWGFVALALLSLLILVVPGVTFLVARRIPPFLAFVVAPLGRKFRAQPRGTATAEQVRLIGWHHVSFGIFWCAQPMMMLSANHDAFPIAVPIAIMVILVLVLIWSVLISRKLRATL